MKFGWMDEFNEIIDFDLYLGDVDPNGARPVPPIRRPTLSPAALYSNFWYSLLPIPTESV